MNTQSAPLTPEELALRGIRIPPQPQVLLELERVMASDDYDARSIARIIERDAGIAAMLFKVARNPMFAGNAAPSTLDKAIIRLGFRPTLNIARAVALSTTLGQDTQRAYTMFWAHSRELAMLAAQIAEERVSVCNIFPEQAYLAGIFLKCGVPVLMQRFPDYCSELLREDRMDFPSLREEDQRFNVDHCTIGYLVARHWRLPDFIAEAILHHGEVPRDEFGATRSLVAILHLASHVRHSLAGSHNASWPRYGHEVLAELCLHPDEFPEYLADLKENALTAAA